MWSFVTRVIHSNHRKWSFVKICNNSNTKQQGPVKLCDDCNNRNLKYSLQVELYEDLSREYCISTFTSQEYFYGHQWIIKKNPAYGRQSISRPMRVVAPMPYEGGPRIPQNPIFLKNAKNHWKRKNSKTSRIMPKLAIRPLTRGLKSIGKRGIHHVL